MKTERTLILRYFFSANLGHLFKFEEKFFFSSTLCLKARVSKVAVTFPARNQIFKSKHHERIKVRFC